MGVKDALFGSDFYVKAASIISRRAVSQDFGGLADEVRATFGFNNEAMTQLVTGFIALAIIVSIGVIILGNVDTAMPALNASSAYYPLQSTIATTTVSSYGLIVIVLVIVAAAGLMMAVRLIQR